MPSLARLVCADRRLEASGQLDYFVMRLPAADARVDGDVVALGQKRRNFIQLLIARTDHGLTDVNCKGRLIDCCRVGHINRTINTATPRLVSAAWHAIAVKRRACSGTNTISQKTLHPLYTDLKSTS